MSTKTLNLSHVAFYGRTLEEYKCFLDLDIEALKGKRVLDCPAGAASFTAEANRLGIESTACDPLYGTEASNLLIGGRRDIEHVIENVGPVPELFKWEYYSSLEHLEEKRKEALCLFADDFQAKGHADRYKEAALPYLPFPDGHFDLVISGHFLFTYHQFAGENGPFDYDFHLKSILELIRVSRGEVRIYPLQTMKSAPYPYLEKLLSEVNKEGHLTKISPVSFEFQKGSNKMLRIVPFAL